jgi:tetratricopeptide (TPR) repeat protein
MQIQSDNPFRLFLARYWGLLLLVVLGLLVKLYRIHTHPTLTWVILGSMALSAVTCIILFLNLLRVQSLSYLKRGLANSKSGNYKQAIENYNQALKLNKNSLEALTMRGTAYFQLKDNKSALDDFNKAIELDSNRENSYEVVEQRALTWEMSKEQ